MNNNNMYMNTKTNSNANANVNTIMNTGPYKNSNTNTSTKMNAIVHMNSNFPLQPSETRRLTEDRNHLQRRRKTQRRYKPPNTPFQGSYSGFLENYASTHALQVEEEQGENNIGNGLKVPTTTDLIESVKYLSPSDFERFDIICSTQ